MAVTIIADRVTKDWAVESLKGEQSMFYLNGSVMITYAENTGAWGSMGSELPPTWRLVLLTILPALFLLGLMVHTFINKELKPYMVICYALVVGGGIGNLIDRMMQGYVVDFLWVGFGKIGTNIFNVADMAIMAGVIALIGLHFVYERKQNSTGT
jgi:signal peptidase II